MVASPAMRAPSVLARRLNETFTRNAGFGSFSTSKGTCMAKPTKRQLTCSFGLAKPRLDDRVHDPPVADEYCGAEAGRCDGQPPRSEIPDRRIRDSVVAEAV